MALRLRTFSYACLTALLSASLFLACGEVEQPLADLEQEDDDRFSVSNRGEGGGASRSGAEQPLDPYQGVGVDGACVSTSECRYGLVCDEGQCRAIANTPSTGFCFLSDECFEGLYCSDTGICRSAGEGLLGDPCSDAGSCERGLYCHYTGLLASCAEAGQGDIDAECASTADCLAGLFCDAEKGCTPLYLGLEQSLWPGLECADANATNPRPFFELNPSRTEFFRLPYPNDIYLDQGTIDLSAFPNPGSGVVGFDPVVGLAQAAERSQEGFSLTPTVTFRFSAVMDFQSLSGTANGALEEATIHFVNVDPDSPGYGGGPSYNWHVTDGAGSAYICPRWLALRVGWSSPLLPGTTYAAYLTQGARDQSGELMSADEDFVSMLQATQPDGELKRRAWEVFAPLRDYLSAQDIAPDTLIGGTVFTTQRPRARMVELRDAVEASALSTTQNVVLCGSDEPSPCTGEPCAPGEGDFDILHMEVELPRVQQGVRPFLNPGDGGGLSPAGEVLQLHGSDSVCAALSVPKGEAPAAGWPLLLFAHESAGDYSSGVSALAPLLSDAGIAVMSWNGPMKAGRGDATFWSEALIFNLANPSAALGSFYQGAADIFALARMAESWSLSAEESPTGVALDIDSEHLAFMGHGLGASIGAISVPHEARIGLSVWSSASAVLSEIMSSRLVPVDVPKVVSLMMHEGEPEELEARHPLLSLYQGLFEAVDPLAHLALQSEGNAEDYVQHSLQIQGVGDWYAPSRVTDVVSRLIGADLASPILREIEGVDSVAPPVSNNAGTESLPRTSVVIQATPPDGADGEPAWPAGEAWREDLGVRGQLRGFIQSWLDDGVPTLSPRSGS